MDWVIIALFMSMNYCGKMEFSCTIMRNWVGEVLADFSFHVWVGGQFYLGDHLKFQTALKVLMVLIYLYMVFTF